jgi:hypothetical protein
MNYSNVMTLITSIPFNFTRRTGCLFVFYQIINLPSQFNWNDRILPSKQWHRPPKRLSSKSQTCWTARCIQKRSTTNVNRHLQFRWSFPLEMSTEDCTTRSASAIHSSDVFGFEPRSPFWSPVHRWDQGHVLAFEYLDRLLRLLPVAMNNLASVWCNRLSFI